MIHQILRRSPGMGLPQIETSPKYSTAICEARLNSDMIVISNMELGGFS